MAYTTQAKIENLYKITISGGGVSAIADIIAAVKIFIDRYCGKTFEAVSETRYYDGNGKAMMIVDAFIGSPTVSVLKSDGTVDQLLTEGKANDYITGPYNFTEKNQIILTGWGWYRHFPKRLQALKIVGNFGGSTNVPADIQLVATKLAGSIFNSNAAGGTGALTSIQLGDYKASYGAIDEQAEALGVYSTLDSYRDIDI